jgi:oligopeptide/dipeptide ABC transporter ATP-binding protein
MSEEPQLSVRDLKTYFYSEAGVAKAVDGVTFSLQKGETMGIVGESGSGKTVTALSVMRLISWPGKIVSGAVTFEGEDLLAKSPKEMTRLRGRRISMIFQDPSVALDPVYRVGDQIAEVLRAHQGMTRREAKAEAIRMMDLVGIPSAAARYDDYPHTLSGGMKQRIVIAIALACNPSLLIADEPTTNLDVTIQAQILELMKTLKQKYGSSILLITHDMGVVAETCDRVAVMYAGEIVEYAETDALFYDTKHPYTIGLLNCIPRGKQGKELVPIKGTIPDLHNPPSGCRFHPRCPFAMQVCTDKEPELREVSEGHLVACHLFDE